MQKRSILIIISSIVMLLLSAVTFVFAWFTIVEKTQSIIIYSGKIKIEYKLEEVTGDPILIENPITYNNLVPGDRFKYQLEVKNIGDINAIMSVIINVESSSQLISKEFILEYEVDDNTSSVDLSENRTFTVDKPMAPNQVFIQNFSINFNKDYEGNSIGEYLKITGIEIKFIQQN